MQMTEKTVSLTGNHPNPPRGYTVNPQADPVMTVGEVAAELRCSKAHVYNAVNGKVAGVSTLPVIQMGRRVLVRRSSLERWKQQNESGQE
jgi:excisionase family DNA binding protein